MASCYNKDDFVNRLLNNLKPESSPPLQSVPPSSTNFLTPVLQSVKSDARRSSIFTSSSFIHQGNHEMEPRYTIPEIFGMLKMIQEMNNGVNGLNFN